MAYSEGFQTKLIITTYMSKYNEQHLPCDWHIKLHALDIIHSDHTCT